MHHAPSNLATDPFSILLGHNRWATRRIIEHCAPLTPEQFHQRFEIGLGSLHDTLLHVVGAVRGWSGSIAKHLPAPTEPWPDRPPIGGTRSLAVPWTEREPSMLHTPASLLELNDAACEDFARVVARAHALGAFTSNRSGSSAGVAGALDWAFGETTYRFTIGAAVVHVVTHGSHHRSQCFNMLRRLGRPIDADLDPLEWQIEGEQ